MKERKRKEENKGRKSRCFFFFGEWCEKRLFENKRERKFTIIWGLSQKINSIFSSFSGSCWVPSNFVNNFLIVFKFFLSPSMQHQTQWNSVENSTPMVNTETGLMHFAQPEKPQRKWTTSTAATCYFPGGVLSNSLAIGECKSNCNFRSSWIF